MVGQHNHSCKRWLLQNDGIFKVIQMNLDLEKTLIVNEIFMSIQGESTYAGLPCVFVRLTACDLRCTYCDTAYAFYEGKPISLLDITKEVDRYSSNLVEITGGEPLLQKNVYDLMQFLADRGKVVLLETSGAHDISKCDPRVARIMDIKCPSSGEVSRNRWENISQLMPTDEVKFVIGNREDFDWAIHIIHEHNLVNRCPVLISAVWNTLPLVTLAEWIKECELNVRLQPQLHKILWGDQRST